MGLVNYLVTLHARTIHKGIFNPIQIGSDPQHMVFNPLNPQESIEVIPISVQLCVRDDRNLLGLTEEYFPFGPHQDFEPFSKEEITSFTEVNNRQWHGEDPYRCS
ncbi:hypothetical protein FLI59_33140 [Pseudomonas aeruginosa]|nr:hypothetical protein FLI59_33140 [Pseudomonas aeruginosa]